MTMLRLSGAGTEEDAALAKESRSGGAVGTTASKSTEKEGKSTKRKKKSTSVISLCCIINIPTLISWPYIQMS